MSYKHVFNVLVKHEKCQQNNSKHVLATLKPPWRQSFQMYFFREEVTFILGKFKFGSKPNYELLLIVVVEVVVLVTVSETVVAVVSVRVLVVMQ